MINDQLIISIQEKERIAWLWIKQQLHLKEYSFLKLARIHGVKKQIFSRVKHFPCPKYETIIAKSLGLDPWDLWPDRYDDAHNPNRVSSRYQGHKRFVEHDSKEINGKDCKEK